MKCRKCETPVTEDMIRCPKCGGLIPHVKKSKELSSLRSLKYDVFITDIGKDKEKLVDLLNRILRVKKKKIDKDLERLPLCILKSISSENALKFKERIESIGASVKIQESEEAERGVGNGFWSRNKTLIGVRAVIFSAVILFTLVLLFGIQKYIPTIYKSSDELKLSKKS